MNPELRGDAEKTFDVEQAAAERASIDAEYAAEAAADAAEQAQQWQPGDLVDITIKGFKVRRVTAYGRIVILDERDMPYVLPPQAAIERAKPAGWPPLVGDLWEADTGSIVGPGRLLGMDVVETIGGLADGLIDDGGAAYTPDDALQQFRALRLLYRDGGTPS